MSQAPSLVGWEAEGARERLLAAGFTIRVLTTQPPASRAGGFRVTPPWRVVQQRAEGEEVLLVVAQALVLTASDDEGAGL